MRKLLVVLVCTVATGLVLCQPALSQTNANDDSHPYHADSDGNHDRNSHVVPIGAIGVPGTSDANPL